MENVQERISHALTEGGYSSDLPEPCLDNVQTLTFRPPDVRFATSEFLHSKLCCCHSSVLALKEWKQKNRRGWKRLAMLFQMFQNPGVYVYYFSLNCLKSCWLFDFPLLEFIGIFHHGIILIHICPYLHLPSSLLPKLSSVVIVKKILNLDASDTIA